MRTVRTPLPWLAGLILAYLLVPLAAFLVRIPGTDPAAMAAPGVGAALRTSLLTATIATGIVTLLGVPLGYLLAHAHGRVAAVLGVLVQLPLALPPLVSGILLIFLVGPYSPIGELFGGALTDNAVGIVLAQCFVAAPFLVVSARSAFAAADPALEDVAATLGHGPLARVLRVALPVAAGGIRAGVLLAWLRAFGEFGATVVLAYHPYSLPVFIYVQFSSTGLAATTIPVAATLGAALVLLLLAEHWPGGRRRRGSGQAVPLASRVVGNGVASDDSPVAGPKPPKPLGNGDGARPRFRVRARLGEFVLDVDYAGNARHVAILGPSGSGKSATLRVLAGLHRLESGHVELGGTDVAALPPERRGIGYLPQDPTLLPHLRAWQQITFGVRADPELARYWLARLHLTGLADRFPDQLSGGQRRRVAMARALVRSPRLLLLDEPFTGLDAPVRDELRRVLRKMQRDTGLPTVLVTHDPEEAALLSEEIILLADGRVLQTGETESVLRHPATVLAARLLGIRNLGSGLLEGPRSLRAGSLRIELPEPAGSAGTPVFWCVRPEDVALVDPHTPQAQPATVLDVVHLGPVLELSVRLAEGAELTVAVPVRTPGGVGGAVNGLAPPRIGAICWLAIPPDSVKVWPAPAKHDIMAP